MRNTTANFLAVCQARKEKTERVYQVRAEIQIKAFAFRGFERDALQAAIETVTARMPWRDCMTQEFTAPDSSVEHDEPIFEVPGVCSFVLNSKGWGFETTDGLLPMRRGQLAAFEKWVQELIKELKRIGPPLARMVQAQVHTSRTFPQI